MKAPEKIWAYTGEIMEGVPSWEWGLAYQTSDMESEYWPDPVEYIRADLVEAKIKEARIAALEEAAKYLNEVAQKWQDHNEARCALAIRAEAKCVLALRTEESQ